MGGVWRMKYHCHLCRFETYFKEEIDVHLIQSGHTRRHWGRKKMVLTGSGLGAALLVALLVELVAHG